MNFLPKYTWTLLFSLLCFSSHSADKIRVAYVDAPPYAYTDKNGQAQGLLIETFREISSVIGAEPQFIYLPHRRQIDFIQQGKIDLWAGQTNSQVSNALSWVSDTPLLNMQLQVYWKQGTESVKTFDELHDKHLVLISSYAYGGNHTSLVANSQSVTYAVDHADAFNILFSGRHKYLLGYHKISQQVIERFNVKGVQSHALAQYLLYLKLSKKYPNAPTLMPKIDAFLAQKNGTAE